MQRPIFVAATRQHVGKTTVSLALMSGLKKRFDKVGFLKPVGQQHVTVFSNNQNASIRVDKDVCLVREHFRLDHIDYEHMSPVIIPQGYTKQYVDGEISYDKQLQDVEGAMQHVTDASDVVMCEGTGHCAVGSIVNVNNAKIASVIGADMILIANGGLGSAFDELELNRILCQHYNVRIAGVIINKVRSDKYEQTKHYLSKAMKKAWGIPLLGEYISWHVAVETYYTFYLSFRLYLNLPHHTFISTTNPCRLHPRPSLPRLSCTRGLGITVWLQTHFRQRISI